MIALYFVANDIDTDNYKKIKRNSFEKLHETSSTVTNVIVAHNTNDTNSPINVNSTNKNENTSPLNLVKVSANKSNEIGKNDEELLKCTSKTTNIIFNPPLNDQKNLTIQSVPFYKVDREQHLNHIITQLKENGVSVQKENSAAHKSTDYVTESELSKLLFQVPSINSFYLPRIENSNFKINQSAVKTNKTNVYDIPSSTIILPHVNNNIAMLNNQTIVNQPIIASASIRNDNQSVVNQQEATSKGNVPANATSAGNNFSKNVSKSYVSNSKNSKSYHIEHSHYKNLEYFFTEKLRSNVIKIFSHNKLS